MNLNNAAWGLLTSPAEPRLNRVALLVAKEASAIDPSQSFILNTLGVAHCRCGQYSEAIGVLERSLAAGQGAYDGFDLFFLAMARHRLGQTEAARANFEQAVRWVESKNDLTPVRERELRLFRAEAEAILTGPASELPTHVFASEG